MSRGPPYVSNPNANPSLSSSELLPLRIYVDGSAHCFSAAARHFDHFMAFDDETQSKTTTETIGDADTDTIVSGPDAIAFFFVPLKDSLWGEEVSFAQQMARGVSIENSENEHVWSPCIHSTNYSYLEYEYRTRTGTGTRIVTTDS